MSTRNPGATVRDITGTESKKWPRLHDDLITLAEVPELLESFFDLEPDSIPKSHVYVWWDRSVNNRDIKVPMPTPSGRVGSSYVWTQEQILHWYGAWKNLVVRECPEAGDIIGRNGRLRRSSLRIVYGSL